MLSSTASTSPSISPVVVTPESPREQHDSCDWFTDWITDAQELRAYRDQWFELSQRAIRPNLFWEPNVLLPAMSHLAETGDGVLLVKETQPDGQGRLMGLLPLADARLYRMPFRCFSSWSGDQCFDGTPLLDRTQASEVLSAMFLALRDRGVQWLNLEACSGDPEFNAVLDDAIQRDGLVRFTRSHWQRAALMPAESTETYQQAHVSKSIRRNLRRSRRRLKELGTVETTIQHDSVDADWVIREFLRLEASGWKGEAGTALACDPKTKGFFEAMVRESASAGRLVVLSILLDGNPIAMLCDFTTPTHGVAYKTAFDDSFQQYSPGLIAELENIEAVHQRPGIEWVDSATASNNQTMNRIWGQRLPFQNVLVSLQVGTSRWVVNRLPQVQSCWRTVRSWRQK